MKNACVTVEFDTEKMGALKIYLKQKDTSIEEELLKELEILYEKNVPSGVKNYIEMRENAKPKERRGRTPRGSSQHIDVSDDADNIP